MWVELEVISLFLSLLTNLPFAVCISDAFFFMPELITHYNQPGSHLD